MRDELRQLRLNRLHPREQLAADLHPARRLVAEQSTPVVR